MEVDRTIRNSWSQQASSLNTQSTTTSYKAYEENNELPARRKHASTTNEGEVAHVDPTEPLRRNESLPQFRKLIKSFKLTTRPFGFNYTITEATKYEQPPVYFVVGTEFTRNTPDLVLYAGANKDGDRLAVAYFRFSRHIRLGFGTQTLSTGEGVWEEMRNTSTYLGHGRYEFEYNTPKNDGDFQWDIGEDAGRTRKKYVWERTRNYVDGVKGKIEQNVGWRNYRLVEQGSGTVLAVMLTSMFTGCSDKGVINLHERLSTEMERVVILTAMCICEKGERRIRRHA